MFVYENWNWIQPKSESAKKIAIEVSDSKIIEYWHNTLFSL